MLVTHTPLDASQFQSQAERGRAASATGEQACTRHGLSVFPDRESCVHQRTLFPRLGAHIASASLTAQHGKTANTGSNRNPSHQTWWPYLGVVRHELFEIMGE